MGLATRKPYRRNADINISKRIAISAASSAGITKAPSTCRSQQESQASFSINITVNPLRKMWAAGQSQLGSKIILITLYITEPEMSPRPCSVYYLIIRPHTFMSTDTERLMIIKLISAAFGKT